MTTSGAPKAVECFLTGLQTGAWENIEDHLDPEVVYDASVPGWHYQYQGRDRIAAEYRSEWTGRHPWRLLEVNVDRCASGDVLVDFEARWGDPGDEEACRMANIFRFNAAGLIREHRLYCCGEWDPETVRRVDTAAPRVTVPRSERRLPASS